ncbi:MAG: RhuM family protein [Candidatus Woesearchaeota archaeon]
MDRANAKENNMGLTSWKNSSKGKIIKTDVSVAKNYLTKDELESL